MRLSAKLGRALALAFLILLYPALAIIFHGHPSTVQVTAILVLLALTVAIYAVYWLRFVETRDWRVVTTVVAALFLLAIPLNLVSDSWTVNPFLLAILVAGFGYRLPQSAYAVVGLSMLTLVISQPAMAALKMALADVVALDVVVTVQLLIFGLAALGASWLVSTIQQLRAAREQIALMAVEQERARFARDLHDLIGRSLSVITLKGELAQQLVDGAPAQARSEIHDIVQVARGALREVREAVSGYRQPTLASELAGARAALAAAGIDCRVDQAAGALTGATEAVLAWTVREGATNVLRHSKAHRCSIVLTRDDDAVRLEVVDDGVGSSAPQAGNGLRGLGERVREQGGRLEAEPLPHQGFRLRVSVPLKGSSELAHEPTTSVDLSQ